jgi:hypothetical protein
VYVPGGQASHSDQPLPEKFPAAQAWQTATEVAPTAVPKDPAGQLEQVLAALQNRPAAQPAHAVLPTATAATPAAHGAQGAEPLEKVPGAQAVHCAFWEAPGPVENVPRLQRAHAVAPRPVKNAPASQGAHSAAPVPPAYAPGAHPVHADDAEPEKLPAAHCAQTAAEVADEAVEYVPGPQPWQLWPASNVPGWHPEQAELPSAVAKVPPTQPVHADADVAPRDEEKLPTAHPEHG